MMPTLVELAAVLLMPGAVEQAKIFDRGTAAHLVSEQLGGRMIRVYEEEPTC